MKKIKGAAAALAVTLLFSGCTLPGDKNNHVQDNMTDSYSYTNEDYTEPTGQAYSWIMEPTVSADNIIVFDGSVVDPDNEDNKGYAEYAVIRVGGKYGLINYKGSMVVEAEYDDYYTCWCGEIVLFNVIDAKNDEYEYCTIDSTGTVAFSAPLHRDNAPRYYWDESLEKVFVVNGDGDEGQEYTGKKAVAVRECKATESGGSYVIDVEDGAFCGLAKKGELLTGIDYVDYYAPAYKGAGATLVAFKDTQGMWGYLDSDGNTVIDFKCSGDINAYNGEVMDDPNKSHPYLFNGDYVPVCVDGAYGYYDKDGNVVVHPGDLGQARPVHNGRAWVRVGNYWGIIQLGEIVEAEPRALETSATTTTKKTTTSSATSSTTTSTTTTTTADTSLTVTSLSESETTLVSTDEPVVTTEPVTEPVVTETELTQDTAYTEPEPVVTDPAPIETQPAVTDTYEPAVE